eukprot:CAMPEP_0180164824 /NCGR_PEP_ID=MMETSP0986-20121125/30603_1 /TAXON_ID=697907 /ORGANISM="non described non described, Strain CCMP2293" /LENGTH=40 /DNA_ID= /DNA_START= /DNA_END= /DNA_ORIENTATION=
MANTTQLKHKMANILCLPPTEARWFQRRTGGECWLKGGRG